MSTASADELVARGITRALLPHGLGHSLGVVTHDVGMKPHAPRPDNKFLRSTSVIEAGQVFTIEPGIYFVDALLAPLAAARSLKHLLDWGAIDELRPFGGIRIEDNVVVEAAGIRNGRARRRGGVTFRARRDRQFAAMRISIVTMSCVSVLVGSIGVGGIGCQRQDDDKGKSIKPNDNAGSGGNAPGSNGGSVVTRPKLSIRSRRRSISRIRRPTRRTRRRACSSRSSRPTTPAQRRRATSR